MENPSPASRFVSLRQTAREGETVLALVPQAIRSYTSRGIAEGRKGGPNGRKHALGSASRDGGYGGVGNDPGPGARGRDAQRRRARRMGRHRYSRSGQERGLRGARAKPPRRHQEHTADRSRLPAWRAGGPRRPSRPVVGPKWSERDAYSTDLLRQAPGGDPWRGPPRPLNSGTALGGNALGLR